MIHPNVLTALEATAKKDKKTIANLINANKIQKLLIKHLKLQP